VKGYEFMETDSPGVIKRIALRELFDRLPARASERYGGIWNDLLLPWLEAQNGALCAPENFKSRTASQYLHHPDELYDLYVLSRINDLLLLPLQRGPGFKCKFADISLSQYEDFFRAIGMTSFIDRPFSPYYHEVVEIEEVDSANNEVQVTDLLWPGLLFGDMLFSRAGVKVRCRRGVFSKQLIELSPLYFSYRRLRREGRDLSHGWGSNSQWRTIFHRNYEDDEAFYYNVDGRWIIGAENDLRYPIGTKSERLTNFQRIEVLKYRCWVTKDGGEAFPFEDRHIELKTINFT
jgi:hypothetical protein